MLGSMAFRESAACWGSPEPESNRDCGPAELIEQSIVAIRCGACRFAHAETTRVDRKLVRLFGRHGRTRPHLFLAFVDEACMVPNFWLRQGNAHSANNRDSAYSDGSDATGW